MFAVISNVCVQPPPAMDKKGAGADDRHFGLGFDGEEVVRDTMTRMRMSLPYHMHKQVVDLMAGGAAVAYDGLDKSVSYAECTNSLDGQKAFLVMFGRIDNDEEMRDLYGLLPASLQATDTFSTFTSTSAQLLLALYCKGFVDAYGDQSAQPQTCLDAIRGQYSFILYDASCNYVLAARSAGAPLFWGCSPMGALLLSSNLRILSEECTSGPGAASEFPAGSYFEGDSTSEDGHVKSYVKHGQPMKGVNRINSHGQLCGTLFRASSTGDMEDMIRISTQGNITAN
eukprot:SM000006S19408  [mRNA]  locus=s6:500079:502252:- [translate_table: standard]